MLRQICQALRTAHANGLIHRDIKPGNIMVARPMGMDESAKVLDFGLAESLRIAGITGTGIVVGTPAYMAPEQASGEGPLDHRVDIYALGCVGYFLLTGAPPFVAQNTWAVLLAHLDKEASRPSALRPEIPIDLEEVVMKCLSKAPESRYQDAKSLERELAKCNCVNHWDEAEMDRWWNDQPQLDRRLACATPANASTQDLPPRRVCPSSIILNDRSARQRARGTSRLRKARIDGTSKGLPSNSICVMGPA